MHFLNRRKQRSLLRTIMGIALVILLVDRAFAQGGPPLVTDDPGTPGSGNWEINVAMQQAAAAGATIRQFPLFDINYGYGDRLQLNLATSWITVESPGETPTNGMSVASAAIKWRFVDEETSGIAISTYPRIDFHHGVSSDDPAINMPGSRYFLPLEFSKEFGPFGINPEIGYATYSQFASEWDYGVAFSWALEKEKEILFEIHGRNAVGGSDHEWLYNFGTRYELVKSASLIAAIGRTFVAYSDGTPGWNAYVGMQIRL